MKIRPLTVEDAEYIAHRYAQEMYNFADEPIPPFSTRLPGKLESCLATPFQTYGGRCKYHYFEQRAAALFYLVSKDHCFTNGNKRMAVTLTSVFFFLNKRSLTISDITLYGVCNAVAKSPSSSMDEVINILTELFKKNSKPLPKRDR